MPYVTISTNGLKAFPMTGFEDLSIALTVFGGGPLDDELRAIKPGGHRFSGLFDTALKNYRNDDRVFVVYAITEDGIAHIDETVKKIEDNGNVVTFNFYSKYDTNDPLIINQQKALLDEALRIQSKYPQTVLSTPYYIEAMITGRTHWDSFGYAVCPSISIDHPAHAARLENGNRSLPLFNAYAPDLETVNFCCTSGHCADCRDSQAVFSWLMVSAHKFQDNTTLFSTWNDLAVSYWAQFKWSPFHRNSKARPHLAGGQTNVELMV